MSMVPHNYRSSPFTNRDINSVFCGRDIDQHNTAVEPCRPIMLFSGFKLRNKLF